MGFIEHLQGGFLFMCIHVSPEQNFKLEFLGSRIWSFRIYSLQKYSLQTLRSASALGAGPAPAQMLGAFWQFLL